VEPAARPQRGGFDPAQRGVACLDSRGRGGVRRVLGGCAVGVPVRGARARQPRLGRAYLDVDFELAGVGVPCGEPGSAANGLAGVVRAGSEALWASARPARSRCLVFVFWVWVKPYGGEPGASR
jgi:hypothetical protein